MTEVLSFKSAKKERLVSEEVNKIVSEVVNIMTATLANTEYDINVVETKMTNIMKKIQQQATEKLIEAQDPPSHCCPHCGEHMENKERLARTIAGVVPYTINRRSFHCSTCDIYMRPLDTIINLNGKQTLSLKEAMLLLGQRIPFDEAREYLKQLLNVDVSTESIRRLVEGVGSAIAKSEDDRVSELIDENGYVKFDIIEEQKEQIIDDTAYMMMDGSMVQTRELKWKEVKNGVLFLQSDNIQADKHHKQITDKKYFSVFNNGESSLKKFTRRTTQEAHEFGFHLYQRQVILGDGAPWIWDYAGMYHPDAIQILDYYHAAEYLGLALLAVNFEDENIEKEQRKNLKDQLWDGQIRPIISFLERQNNAKAITDCIRYFENNIERMSYGKYRGRGLDIGSGAIESAHRTIVQTRMKQSGMHWGKANVQSMISLRAKYLSGQWREVISNYVGFAA